MLAITCMGILVDVTVTPLAAAKGEKVEIMMTNRTGMSHPMHLNGHVFQVVAVNGRWFAWGVQDPVLVPPKTTVTIAFDADTPAAWPSTATIFITKRPA